MQLPEQEKIAHLLRRFGLGASEAEIEYYGKGGLSQAIERLLNCEKHEEVYRAPIEKFVNPNNGNLIIDSVRNQWCFQLITTRRPLVEAMTVFWHDHFATSAQKVVQAPLMYRHLQMLRTHALGNFKELLFEVCKDPAMIFWLDGQLNVKGKAQENLAREVMELFTLGVDNYTEKDVQECARAFTGHTFQRKAPKDRNGIADTAVFIFRPRQHDNGVKTVLGKTGNFKAEDVLEILCENPQTARYLTKKIWEWFVYPNVEDATIEPFAKKFKDSDYDIKTLLRAIMNSSEFYSPKAVRAIVKNPVDFVVSTVRSLGIGEQVGEAIVTAENEASLPRLLRAALLSMRQAMDAMGMKLLFPPDVAGWETGTAWISSATMMERILWADRLFGQAPQGTRRIQMNYQAAQLLESGMTVRDFAEKLTSIFDAKLPSSKMDLLTKAGENALEGKPLNRQSANKAASSICKLIFGSPEFQMN